MTQSAAIGTASDAIARLGLAGGRHGDDQPDCRRLCRHLSDRRRGRRLVPRAARAAPDGHRSRGGMPAVRAADAGRARGRVRRRGATSSSAPMPCSRDPRWSAAASATSSGWARRRASVRRTHAARRPHARSRRDDDRRGGRHACDHRPAGAAGADARRAEAGPARGRRSGAARHSGRGAGHRRDPPRRRRADARRPRRRRGFVRSVYLRGILRAGTPVAVFPGTVQRGDVFTIAGRRGGSRRRRAGSACPIGPPTSPTWSSSRSASSPER